MFKNKIKYSLLVGSLYNVKCDYIFNVYINGEKTKLTKRIDWILLSKINSNSFSKDNSFEFEGKKFSSYKKYKKEHLDYKSDFDDYLEWVLFYKESQEGGILKDCYYNNIMKHSIEGMGYYEIGYNSKISQYSDIKEDKSGIIKIDVYFVKKAEYKILNETEVLSEDFINSSGGFYKDKTVEESIKLCLETIKAKNYCLTYKELLEKLNLFDVYIDGKQIKSDDKKYITPEEAKKLVLKPKLEFQKKKTITLYFDNNDNHVSRDISIPSYVTLKYIKETSKYNDIWDKNTCYNIHKYEGLEFYKNNGYSDKIGDNDIIKSDIYVKVKQYFVTTFTDNIFPTLLSSGEFVDVNNLDDYINEYKKKNNLIGKKHSICAVVQDNLTDKKIDFKKILTNHICVIFSSKIDEPKEESKEEPKEQDKPTEEKPKEEPNPTGDKPTDDSEVVKKTALIKECKDLVNKIKALDSSYNKTINASDSVENLESLKTELTNKLDELKKEKQKPTEVPNPTEVPKNSDSTNTEPTSTNGGNNSTDGGNTGKNNKKKMCENGCCKNKTK